MGLTAKRGMEIFLPRVAGAPALIRHLEYVDITVQPATPPPAACASEALWAEIRASWATRAQVVDRASSQLASWMLGDDGEAAVRRCIAAGQQDGIPRRITIDVPEWLSGWPWEAAAVTGEPPLAVHADLTVVRRIAVKTPPPGPALGDGRRVLLVGVQLEDAMSAALSTGAELELARQCLESIPAAQALHIDSDDLGTWTRVAELVRDTGPPDVLHFGGHGTAEALQFRDVDGRGVWIHSSQIAAVLAASRGARCQLVVLNACRTSQGGRRDRQPFGSLAHRLVEQGVPAVVGHEIPIRDMDAVEFATALYGELAQGSGVDIAVRAGRRRLHANVDHGSWPFVVLALHHDPSPVFSGNRGLGAAHVGYLMDNFAFTQERTDLKALLGATGARVIVTHGPVRAGHRYVLDRVRTDLLAAGWTVWHPIPALPWYSSGEPLLDRAQMLGLIAAALGKSSHGSDDELRTRIVGHLKAYGKRPHCCVFDVTRPCIVESKDEAAALVALVAPIWRELIGAAQVDGAYLLLSIAYAAGPQERYAQRACRALERLDRRGQPFRVRILALGPIPETAVAKFLEEAVGMVPASARRRARSLARGYDNEFLLDRLRILLSKETA